VLALLESGELLLSPDGLRLLERAGGAEVPPGLAVLLVEDDDEHAQLVTTALESALAGAVIARASSVAAAEELVNGADWSLAIVDHLLPDGPGVDVLDALRHKDPGIPVLMLTGQGAEETAVEAFRHGASDYVVKGAQYVESLTVRVRSLVAA
jgi:DNA-binding response OmpR family regulator